MEKIQWKQKKNAQGSKRRKKKKRNEIFKRKGEKKARKKQKIQDVYCIKRKKKGKINASSSNHQKSFIISYLGYI